MRSWNESQSTVTLYAINDEHFGWKLFFLFSQEDEETLVVVVGKHFYFVRRSNAKNWVRLLS